MLLEFSTLFERYWRLSTETFGIYTQRAAENLRWLLSYLRKYVREVLANLLGGLSLPRKSVVRLTDRPDMTIDVYRGRKTTTQQQRTLLN